MLISRAYSRPLQPAGTGLTLLYMKCLWFVVLVTVIISLPACAATETSPIPSPAPTPASLPDTPPPPIAGLITADAYDGKVNLWWDNYFDESFDYYNIYMSKAEIADVGDISPTQQIKNTATGAYQVTGLARRDKRHNQTVACIHRDNGNPLR